MVVESLKENGVEDNTVIIYTSDNGFLCGSHGYGSKVLPYEESVRVPMIIYDPRIRTKKNGLRINALTANIDIAPTILELAGTKASSQMNGLSLMPLVQESKSDLRESIALMNCWGPIQSQYLGIVTKKWKYIYWFYGEGMKPKEELFNLDEDRLELINATKDPQSNESLEEMRLLYDQEIITIKGQSAVSHKMYETLFDRSVEWPNKKKIIKKQ
jgi:arylsulfatase A-like enzyme